jgi:autotransporter-associated beta strand protein
MGSVWLVPLLAGAWLLGERPLRAEVSAASGAQSLGSVVNGVTGGSCSSGPCTVSGGTAAGANLFHRMSAFDTRGAITGVQFVNGGQSNVIVGVTSPFGTHIDKLVSLSHPGNLLFLSPGGLSLSGAAGFFQINHLGLTTANTMAFGGGGVFDVFNTSASQAAGLTGNPLLGARNLMVDPAARLAAGIHGVPGIVADGISISVDRELLIDAVDGSVKVQDSTLALTPWQGQGGKLSLLGSEVLVEGASQLLATGSTGGGLIQVGGSWQNSNPEVRQAVRTAFGSRALADASAIDAGNGGTIVLWSDVFNPSSFTTATGNLKAEGGRQGGDGGRLETSGYRLDLAGLRVSTMATKGKTGVWLLDPSDITITNTTPTIQGVGTNPVVFSTGDDTAQVNVVDLQNALGASNVEITTAGAGEGSGDITLASDVAVNTETTLTLKADRNIVLNANYSQSGVGWLELLAGQGQQVTGGVSGFGNVSLNGGSLVVETDTTNPSNYTGILSGANTNLVKRGVGVFSLGAANTYTGSTTVREGELRISTNGSIADTSALTVEPTATFRLSRTGAETIGSLSGGGSVVLNTTDSILSVGAANTSTTFSGVISGSGSLVKDGAGTFALAGANTYSGGTTINDGAIRLLSPTALGSGQILVRDGGMLDLYGTTVTTDNPLTLNGNGNGLGALVNSSLTPATYPGLVTLGSDSWIVGETGLINLTNPGTITGDGHTLTLGGAEGGEISSIIGTGSGDLIKTGAGTWVLAGDNTYTGATTVNAGTLTVNGSGPSSATCNNGATSNVCTPGYDDEDVAYEYDYADYDYADDEQWDYLVDLFAGEYSEGDLIVIDETLDSFVSGDEDSLLIISESVDFDGLSDFGDEFTGGDFDGATDFSSSQAAESATSDAPDSFEGALALSDAAGETSLSAEGFEVDVSLGSSFAVEAQGDAESAESSTVGSSSEQSSASSPESSNDSTGSLAGDPAEPSASSDSSSAPENTTPGGTPVANVSPQQAVVGLAQSDQAQSAALVNALLPEQRGSAIATPSVTQMQSGLSNAAATIRSAAGAGALGTGPRGGTGMGPAERLGPQSWLPRGLLLSTDSDQLMASANTLIAASDVGRAALLPPSFNRAAYNPAILHVRFAQGREKLSSSSNDAFLDITLIPLEGEPEGRRVELSQVAFANDLRTLYRQLSRQESLQVDDPKSPSRRLYDQLFAAITPVLQQRKITTLLISADRGLQAVPFAALHNGDGYFGDRYAFSLTPSLALTNLSPPTAAGGRLLAMGASEFEGLAPLPLVPTELTMMSSVQMKDTALNRQFTPSTLFELAADSRYSRVHVATHAEFLPGGPAKSNLYSGTVPIALSDFVKLRLARRDAPLDLITFSACRTALGDADSELGFAGLALQAGARSAVGTLWYVDDVATSAYFVQLYRYLEAGVPKAEALQLTRQAFVRGLVRLQGDQIVGPDGAVLTTGLTTSQQRRASGGFANPYFWAGIGLLGSPW